VVKEWPDTTSNFNMDQQYITDRNLKLLKDLQYRIHINETFKHYAAALTFHLVP